MQYPIIIHKDSDSDYGVTVPDMPGCFSAGSTYEEALVNAKEAICCHIEGLLLDKQPIPVAQTIERYKNKPEHKGGVWAIVGVDMTQLSGKIKRVNITLPERLLRSMDYYAQAHGIKSRSQLIADATLQYIASDSTR